MGMFDKDKEYGLRLDQEFDLRENFVLLSAKVTDGDTMETELGTAQVARLECMHLNEDGKTTGDIVECNTIASAIVEKCKEAEDHEFPAIVRLIRVDSKRFPKANPLALRFVGPYKP